MYVVDLDSVKGDNLSCLSAQADNANLWHRQLGNMSSSVLKKAYFWGPGHGLSKLKFF